MNGKVANKIARATIIVVCISAVAMYVVNPYGISSLDPRSRLFGYTFFSMPSGSMLPTIEAGEKFITETKAYTDASPTRGDVVVFEYPEDRNIYYIKRVVGVPGDKISYKNKILYINDIQVKTKQLGKYVKDLRYIELSETFGDTKHNILNILDVNQSPPIEVIVPDGNYFMLGDNRDNSRDSRYWGFVPNDHLVGKYISTIDFL